MKNVTPEEVSSYKRALYSEFPKLKIKKERPWWLRFIFSLPGIKKLNWERSTQAIGNRIYLSSEWDSYSPSSQILVLIHEAEHLRWYKKHTIPLSSLLYLFCFLPIFLAYYRAIFERAAMRKSLIARIEYFGPSENLRIYMLDYYRTTFSGWTYFKMWPFDKTIVAWFNEDWEEATRSRRS